MKLLNIILKTDSHTSLQKAFQLIFVFDIGEGKTTNIPMWFVENDSITRIIKQLTSMISGLAGEFEG